MFALLKGTDAEYSVNDKLREIDVANENVNPSVDYTGKVSFFKCSAAYEKITNFIMTLNQRVQGHTLRELRGETNRPTNTKKINLFASDAQQQQQQPSTTAEGESKQQELPTTSAGILAIQQLLAEIDALVSECPSADKNVTPSLTPVIASSSTAPSAASSASSSTVTAPTTSTGGACVPVSSRFGSPAFRTFLNLLSDRSEQMVTRVLNTANPATLPDPDIEPSEQARTWEKEGFETLKKWKEESSKSSNDAHGHQDHSGHSHAHEHKPHKLPPGVIISHGPHGVGNAPTTTLQHHDHEHKEGDAVTDAPQLDTSPAGKRARIIHHLTRYLLQSFGDIRRLDYGTGHEMNFMCFLYALGECGVFQLQDVTDSQRLIGFVFSAYVQLMRKLQTTYWLEPAGSRGVWGLDDYCFLPFLFGSSQLIGHKHIKPKSVRYTEILDGFSADYLYLDAIRFILSVKTCSFAEHSPMLNDITIIKTWDQVNTGLWRMYQAEVLCKFAVVQHFIYSPMLAKYPIKPLTVEVVKVEDPCCSDSIHFPSSFGAKQAHEPPKI